MVGRHPRSGVLGVAYGIDDKLANVFVFQAVEDRGAGSARADQSGHPQLGQMLGHRRRGLADPVGKLVDRELI
jgi:hypothetical protein